MTPKGRGMMGLVVSQQLEDRQFDTPGLVQGYQTGGPPAVAKLQVPSCLCLGLGVMLITVNLAMPHGTCSLATAGGPPV
ncbi:unnamed protein product [Staurois parvus]|uniref:Uncharacterized protein n=1 Tax=Staurois parvus TaxID=386267 RepID=A0ABN9C134_9NEOB|nr:unnamed protein product [Staurois parvus]